VIFNCGQNYLGKYTLIVTEKPDAAKRIATALDCKGNATKNVEHGVPFYQAYRNGDIIVVPALGHMYTVSSKEKNSGGYPVFNYCWVPRYMVERRSSKIQVWLEVISKLSKGAEVFVDACDFDIEGSIIGYCLLKYACGNKEKVAKRMKYSTLTTEELQQSYVNILPNLDFGLVNAGLARHEIDWLYGINLSRALTAAAKSNSGKYATISTGRVQGPTLKFLEDREKSINSFVPNPYWTIKAKIFINGIAYEFDYEKTLYNKQEANAIMETCKTKEGQIKKITVGTFSQKPPFPFDLGALQSEAYRLFHYPPIRTLNIAQHLYINALISYPRTSSQKLPPQIGYTQILRRLSQLSVYHDPASKLLSKSVLKPNEGIKSDSAHPAIYPTGNLPEKSLGTPERNVFDLVARRFMAVFGEPATRQSTEVVTDINGNSFVFSANQTLQDGWLEFYKPYVDLKNSIVPSATEGQKVEIKRVTLKENLTKPPPRYNPRSLLIKMEKEEIGTKATRAAIIQTLSDRKYLNDTSSLVVSQLGHEVIDVLEKYCPSIISSELTKQLEEEMNQIQEGAQTKEVVLQKAIEILKPVLSELKINQSFVGFKLSEALDRSRMEQRTIGACPKCSDGKLVILRSRRTQKRFVGCSNYFKAKCNITFPLPQMGTIKPLATLCKTCGFPVVYVLANNRKWLLCLNPNCPTKKTNKKIVPK
jgi:DNA topoisomerase I